MYPRGATAHGCSFAPVTTLAMYPNAQVLSTSYERRAAYLPSGGHIPPTVEAVQKTVLFKQIASVRDATNRTSMF